MGQLVTHCSDYHACRRRELEISVPSWHQPLRWHRPSCEMASTIFNVVIKVQQEDKLCFTYWIWRDGKIFNAWIQNNRLSTIHMRDAQETRTVCVCWRACSPIQRCWRISRHMTSSCKGPIEQAGTDHVRSILGASCLKDQHLNKIVTIKQRCKSRKKKFLNL